MKITVCACWLSIVLCFPTYIAAQSATGLNEADDTESQFQILYSLNKAAEASGDDWTLSLSDRENIHSYLDSAVESQYPHDPMHPNNRGFDTSVRLALGLLGDEDPKTAEYAALLLMKDDFPALSRTQYLSFLKGNDQALGEIISHLNSKATNENSADGLLLARAIVQQTSPAPEDIVFLKRVLLNDDEFSHSIASSCYLRWPVEVNFGMALELVEAGKKSGWILLRNLYSAPADFLSQHREEIERLSTKSTEDKEALASLLITRRKMGWISDEVIVRHVTQGKLSRFAKMVVDETCEVLGSEALASIIKDTADVHIRDTSRQILEERQQATE